MRNHYSEAIEVIVHHVEDDGLAVRDSETGELIFEPTRKHIKSVGNL